MARKNSKRAATEISLPPFPWQTEIACASGKAVRTPRKNVVKGTVDLPGTPDVHGDVVANRAKVWRTTQAPVLATLNPSARAAVMDYAEAFGVVHSSGGTSDPSGGGGGGGGARSPNLRAIIGAERLRHMNAALSGGKMVVPLKNARRIRRGDGLARISLRQLAEWVAVDELTRAEVLRRSGAAPSNDLARDGFTLALTDMGERLAICCGYTDAPHAVEKLRNMPGAGV
ncbi:MAG: hypothetical protein AAGL96_14515 [Pseudomonadota bacterium]